MEPKRVVSKSQVLKFATNHFKQAGLGDEPIHGLRHLNNVIKECGIVCEMCALDPRVADLLKIAATVHDIGRTTPGDHAENSANIFSQMPLNGLTPREKSWIDFAVRNHSRGVKATTRHEIASSPEEALLGLLCVCDHADSASPEGYARSVIWAKTFKPHLPIFGNHDTNHLRNIMAGKLPDIRPDDYKNESVIAHLAYNFYATTEIMKAVERVLSEEYIKYAEMRQLMFGKMIELLHELQPL